MSIDAEVRPVERPKPPRPDLYLVIASIGDEWRWPTGFRTLYLTREAAEAMAQELSDAWGHRAVVRIPGDTGDGS